MYEIYKIATDRHTITTPDKVNDETFNNLHESEQEKSPQNLTKPLPKNNFEPLQTHYPSEIPPESAPTQQLPLIDDELQNNLTINKETDIPILFLSMNLTLKRKRHMYYFPMDFEKLTRDSSIDTGALTNPKSEQDLFKINLLALEAISDTGSSPNFQIMVANGQLETPIGTVCLTFEVVDFMFNGKFIVMKVLTKNDNAIFDIRQGVLTFPHLSMQLKHEHNIRTRQSTPLRAEASYTLQPVETMLIASRMPHVVDHDATGFITPSAHLVDHDSFVLVSSLCAVNKNAVGYQICNFSEVQYTITAETHLADFQFLTPDELKFIKPINHSTLTFIIHQHTEITEVYLNELLKVNN